MYDIPAIAELFSVPEAAVMAAVEEFGFAPKAITDAEAERIHGRVKPGGLATATKSKAQGSIAPQPQKPKSIPSGSPVPTGTAQERGRQALTSATDFAPNFMSGVLTDAQVKAEAELAKQRPVMVDAMAQKIIDATLETVETVGCFFGVNLTQTFAIPELTGTTIDVPTN
jgi:hypothetical protein